MIMNILCKMVGLLLILGGVFWGLMTLGFASMINPSLEGEAWWIEWRAGMNQGGGWTGLGTGLVVALFGIGLMLMPPERGTGSLRPVRDDKSKKPGPVDDLA